MEKLRPGRFGARLGAIAVAAAAVRGWLLARPLAALDGRSLPDDAYIALEIARRIGLGDGPRFGDYATNGFQPLFVWLAAIPFAAADPAALSEVAALDHHVKLALGIGCAFDLAALLLLGSIVRRGTGSEAAGLLAAAIWCVQPAVLRSAVNGLETSAAVCLLLAVWKLSLRWPVASAPPSRLFAVGLCVGVAGMARVDLLFLGVCLATASLRAASRTAPTLAWLRRNAALALGAALGYAPWLLYSWHHTKALLPASGRAVRFISVTDAGHRVDAGVYATVVRTGTIRVGDRVSFAAEPPGS